MFEWLVQICNYIVFELFGLDKTTHLVQSLHFFIYDTIKIFILLIVIIYAVTFIRSYFPVEKARDFISKKHKIAAHLLASVFGMLTPFCSCSVVPLFIGFLQARIPLGITFSYLVSAPLNDAVVIALLISIFGYKVAIFYILACLLVAVVSGLIIGALSLEKEVLLDIKPASCGCSNLQTLDLKTRAKEALDYTFFIFKKVYKYVVIGIFIGALIHGYAPAELISKYGGGDVWYAPIIAVLAGIPMYSNAAGILPLIEVLTQKGVLMGTALSFMMAIVALSLPEAMILKRVLSLKLIGIFFWVVGPSIIAIGYIFNIIL
ncbi:permease (DUF318 domain) [Campylobacter iguaniorum]|uniref:Permease (DUF318 domain) n=1 Tax=Campylobacter iguaniorum TaxID=1244531 RepID=A0A076FAW5_9BACT|nr:permease [Campylobacter iguaniorum]AII15141.1 permease (DUF318 domain) [Campylobacter iguaniorum]